MARQLFSDARPTLGARARKNRAVANLEFRGRFDAAGSPSRASDFARDNHVFATAVPVALSLSLSYCAGARRPQSINSKRSWSPG